MRNIYDEAVNVKSGIEPNLFHISFDSQNKAVDEGFGMISYDDPDYAFVNELKYNNGVFAAFKTHRQGNDLAQQLVGADGKLKTFAQFKADTEPIIGAYNKNWLQSEYNTAVIRARMAARFKEFQRDADLYPNLKWIKSTSDIQREAHIELYGLILPLNHPFWTRMFPGDLWNCKCGITNTDEPENGHLYNIDNFDMPVPAGLDGNPAFTGKIFSDSNSYQEKAYKGAEKAVVSALNKLLRIRSRDEARAYFSKLITGKGLQLDVTEGPVSGIQLSSNDVHQLTGKPHKFNFEKNNALLSIEQILKKAHFEYSADDEILKNGLQKHPGVTMWHYYSFNLKGEDSYLIFKEMNDGKYKLHMIQDKDHFLKNK